MWPCILVWFQKKKRRSLKCLPAYFFNERRIIFNYNWVYRHITSTTADHTGRAGGATAEGPRGMGVKSKYIILYISPLAIVLVYQYMHIYSVPAYHQKSREPKSRATNGHTSAVAHSDQLRVATSRLPVRHRDHEERCSDIGDTITSSPHDHQLQYIIPKPLRSSSSLSKSKQQWRPVGRARWGLWHVILVIPFYLLCFVICESLFWLWISSCPNCLGTKFSFLFNFGVVLYTHIVIFFL